MLFKFDREISGMMKPLTEALISRDVSRDFTIDKNNSNSFDETEEGLRDRHLYTE